MIFKTRKKKIVDLDREAIEAFVDHLQDVGFDIYDCDGNPANIQELINEHFKIERKA